VAWVAYIGSAPATPGNHQVGRSYHKDGQGPRELEAERCTPNRLLGIRLDDRLVRRTRFVSIGGRYIMHDGLRWDSLSFGFDQGHVARAQHPHTVM